MKRFLIFLYANYIRKMGGATLEIKVSNKNYIKLDIKEDRYGNMERSI